MFTITSAVALPGGTFGFSWEGQSGVVYEVWWTDNLLDGWPSGQVETTTGSDWAETNLLLQRRFYRFGIQ